MTRTGGSERDQFEMPGRIPSQLVERLWIGLDEITKIREGLFLSRPLRDSRHFRRVGHPSAPRRFDQGDGDRYGLSEQI